MATPAARRRRRALVAAAAVTVGGYAAWTWYSSPRRRHPDSDSDDDAVPSSSGPLATLAGWRDGAAESVRALRRARAAAVAVAGVADTVARDTAAFVEGDGVDLPPSLRQLARLAAAPEVAQATASLAAAATAGALASVTTPAAAGAAHAGRPTPDAALAAVVGAACRSSVREYLDAMGYAGRAAASVPRDASAPDLSAAASPSSARPRRAAAAPHPDPLLDALSVALAWAASPEGGAAMARASSAASAAAVGAWLDRGAGAGGWGQLVAALCAPPNVAGAERLFRAYAGECVETYFAGLRRDRRAARDARRAAAVADADGALALPPLASPGADDDSPLAAAGETPTRHHLALRPKSDAASPSSPVSTAASPPRLPRAPSSDDYSWASEFVRVARAPEARTLAASLVAAACAASVRAAAGEAGAALRSARAALAPPVAKATHALASRQAATAALVAAVAVAVACAATLRVLARAVGLA